jgi:hydroxymethylbilane synthase
VSQAAAVRPVDDRGDRVRIATRGSALALAQARLVADAFTLLGQRHEVVVVETDGDRRTPDAPWGEGAFVKSIERALLEGRADVAVHSAKDVPTDEDAALTIAAYLRREDPRDALVVGAGVHSPEPTVDGLPDGCVVGTDSPRRTGFLRARRPDIEVRPLHGNVDTRLRRLDAGEAGALVLACAGLVRLGRGDRIAQRIPPEIIPPAPGQGAIALQVRADDARLLELGSRIDHRPTRLAVEAERAFLRSAGGGCRAPIGALAQTGDHGLRLLGGFATVDGRAFAIDTISGPVDAADALAEDLAARLTARRARLAGGPRILVTRPAEGSRRLAARLAEHGLEAAIVPAIGIEPAGPGGPLDEELSRLDEFAWAVVTSANGVRSARAAAARLGVDLARVRWAAVGEATERELGAAGVRDLWRPATATAQTLARELPLAGAGPVLLLRGSLPDETVVLLLRERGATVVDVVAYESREAPAESRALLERTMAGGPVAAVIFASPSAVRGLLSLAGPDLREVVLGLPAIAIGPTTAAAARDAGFALLGEAETQDAAALAELTAELVGRLPEGVSA